MSKYTERIEVKVTPKMAEAVEARRQAIDEETIDELDVTRSAAVRGLLNEGLREPTIRAAAEEALEILRTDWREFDDIRTDANETKLDEAKKVLARALKEVQG